MTIGIYGGSFDPIHTGHAIVANFVAQCNVVDEVWIMVSRRNPLKESATVASDSQRLEMARIVAGNCKNVRVSDFEMALPSPSFTINTLNLLKKTYPQHQFKIIIGSDSLENFSQWKESDSIIKNYGVIVYPRPGYDFPGNQPDGFIYLSGAPVFSVSSTLVREYIASGWNINYFVPVNVCEYIESQNLYK